MAGWRWTTETIRVDATDTGRVFERLIKEFGNPFEINRIAAQTALFAMRVAFERGVDPATGQAWPPLKPNTVLAKGNSAPLYRTGKLKASLTPGRPGNVYKITSKRATVGSRLKTAVLAQEGTRPHTIRPKKKKFLRFQTTNGWVFAKKVNHPGTPPRRIVGVSRGTLGEIDKRINRYLDKINREAAGR